MGHWCRQEWPRRRIGRSTRPRHHSRGRSRARSGRPRVVGVRARSRAASRREGGHAVVSARPRSPARPRRRRPAVRPQGLDRRDAERPGGIPSAHARRRACRSSGWSAPMDGASTSISHSARSISPGPKGASPRSALLPLDVFIVASNDPATIMREYGASPGFAELPARWTFGYMQSHRTLAGPEEVLWHRADLSREEAAVRRADLSGHRVHAIGVEYAKRRVCVARREFSGSEGDDRRRCTPCTTRSCCTR